MDADEEDDDEEEDAMEATEATEGGGGGGCTGVEDIRDRSMGAGRPEGGPTGDTAGETAAAPGGTGGGPEGGTVVLPSWLGLLLAEPNSGLRILAMLNLRAPMVGTGGEAHLGRSQHSSGSWSWSLCGLRGLPRLQGLQGRATRGGVSEPTLSTSSSSSSSIAPGGPCGGPCGG